MSNSAPAFLTYFNSLSASLSEEILILRLPPPLAASSGNASSALPAEP
jgi:hypothetical protein